MSLGNISEDCSANDMEKTELNRCVYDFSVDHRPFDTSNIIDILKYLMKKQSKIMFRLIKKMSIGLLTSLVNILNLTKCILLRNQKCEIQPTLNLHLNEVKNQELHYYPFAVKLDKCVGSCNTLMTYLINYVFQTKQKI